MRRLAVLALFAASCGSDGGVIIHVTPTDPNVTVVRLYIGNGSRTTDATLDIPTAVSNGLAVKQAMPSVTYWPRDEQNELDSVAVASGGSAKFVLVRSDTTDIGAIIAVGYAGNQIAEVATMFDVHLPATKFNEYKLTLAKPVQPPIAWARLMPVPAPEATCIGIVDPMQPHPYSSSFIVSPSDQDCDGLIVGDGRECNPDVWFGQRPAALDELTCIRPGIDAVFSCYLGGPECVDDRPVGTTPSCMPSRYCTPKSVCSSCQGSLACAKDITKATIRPAAVSCPMHTSGGKMCEDEIVIHTGSFGGVGCTAASIGDADHGFADRIDRGTFEIFVSLDPADCRVTLKTKGDAPPSNTPYIGLMVAIELDNGNGIALPVVLGLAEQGCVGRDIDCMKDAGTVSPELLDCAVGWSTPMLEGTLVTPQAVPVRSPSLTDDMLEIYWTANEKEVWRSRRSSRIDGWAMPERMLKLEVAGFHTSTARISPDGLTIYLASDRPDAVGGEDLFVARRTTRSETWLTPTRIPELSSMYTDDGGSIDRAGTRIVFSKTEDLMGTRGMYQAVGTSVGSATVWSAVSKIPPFQELAENPHIVEDGSAIYYTGGELGAGKELYTYQRAAAPGQWMLPRRLPELGSVGSDMDAWVSLDQRTIYFASDRSGVMRIYSSRR